MQGKVGSRNLLTVDITDIALPNNYGVAKSDKLVIFVPGGVVGDKVNIRIIRESKRVAYGEILETIAPSPFRKNPDCPHFGPCGGCTLQHLTYEKQLEIKENYVLQTLRRIGGLDVGAINMHSIIPSPDIYFYRNKLELSFGGSGRSIVMGLRERVSPFEGYTGRVVPLGQCPVSTPVAGNIIPVFVKFAEEHGLSAYNPLTGHGLLRHLVLRESKSTGDCMVILETKAGPIPDLIPLWQQLSRLAPEIQGFYRILNDASGDDFHPRDTRHIAGKSYIEETLHNITYRIFPEAFFQPNTKAAEILYRKIADLVELSGQEKVLGLFCGAGAIEIFLSGRAKEVIGIDSDHANILNARENCRANKVNNCLFHEGKIEKVLKSINLDGIDLAIVDPPRGGISKNGLGHIFRVNPRKIAYVSCNPSTMARDLKTMSMHGYLVSSVAPFDLFPQTPHVETLTILHRK